MSPKTHTGIAVVEGTWWGGWNCSVRPTFEMIAEMTCNNSHGFHYEMANSVAALNEAIPRIASYDHCRYLYLATHGLPEGLHLFNKEMVSAAHLRDLLRGTPQDHQFSGLYLASCAFGNAAIAAELHAAGSRLTWIAGYQKDVDWLPSSALDIVFFHTLITTRSTDERSAIEQAATRLRTLVPGLIDDLGFSLYVNTSEGLTDILRSRQ